MFSNLQFHVCMIIMQYYNFKKLQFIYPSKVAVHGKCVTQTNMEQNDGKVLRYHR